MVVLDARVRCLHLFLHSENFNKSENLRSGKREIVKQLISIHSLRESQC